MKRDVKIASGHGFCGHSLNRVLAPQLSDFSTRFNFQPQKSEQFFPSSIFLSGENRTFPRNTHPGRGTNVN